MRDSRPQLATLGSADPDGAGIVAAAPCNIVRVYELRVTPQMRAPLQKPGRGLSRFTVPLFEVRIARKIRTKIVSEKPALALRVERAGFEEILEGARLSKSR
jgi:hypothetical protein